MTRSLLAALAGQCAGAVALLLFGGGLFWGFPPVTFLIIFLANAPVLLAVWLALLWPLYALLPRSGVLWRPRVGVSFGLVAGGLLMLAAAPLYGSTLRQLSPHAYYYVGPITGAVTAAVMCHFKAVEPANAEPSIRSRHLRRFDLGWRRVGRWFTRSFSEWS